LLWLKNPGYYIKNCLEKERKRKNDDYRKKEKLKELKEIMIEMKSKRTANMIDSRKKMKETDRILSFNVLLQKNL
jgi:hypothetical protein